MKRNLRGLVMTSYAVCADIGRNNTGTVTGAMNFFGQMGAFFLALIFGQIVQATHRFDYPVYLVGAILIAGCLLWLGIDAEKQLPEVGDGGGNSGSRLWKVLIFVC